MLLETYHDKVAAYVYEEKPKDYLQKLYSKIDADEALVKSEKDTLLLDIAKQLSELQKQSVASTSDAPLPTSRRADDFPEYTFDGGDLGFPCGVTELWAEATDRYQEWYQHVYLPAFHPMPNQELQHPCLTAIALMNCQATLTPTQKIPLIYFEGKAGSGKSVMADAMRSHYPERLSVEVRPSHTGASLRDELDGRFGTGQPGLVQLDNFYPELQMQRLGNFYDILLATDKKSSVSRISARGNQDDPKSEFLTHSLKVFTSIYNARTSNTPSMQEVSSRCLFFLFQKDDPRYQRDAYQWVRMQKEYRKIWVDDWVINQKPYAKALSKLVRMPQKDTPFRGRNWDLVKVPIAVGVMLGMWDTDGGIEAFDKHVTWSFTQDTGIQSPFAIVVKEFVTSIDVPSGNDVDDDDIYSKLMPKKQRSKVIGQKELFDHVNKVTGYPVNMNGASEIVVMMSGFGYNHRQVNNKMCFVKE